MFNWKDFEKTKDILSHWAGNTYRDEWGQHHVTVRPIDLLDWMEFAKDDLGFFTMVDLVAIEAESENLEIVYHLLNMGSHQRLNIHLLVNRGEKVPSVTAFFSNADWAEREQAEFNKIEFSDKKRLLLSGDGRDEKIIPQLRFNPNKSEAPYPEESYQWKSFDLLSPMTKGNFEWLVCFDPIKVVESKLSIGFHHQGIEKLLESKDLIQGLQLVDKVNLSSAPHFSIAWAKTLEEMFRIRIPERAQAIRIVMLELARIAEHLTVMSSICMESQQHEFKLFINAREKVYELFEKYSGHRQGFGVANIGGVKEDLPHGWIVEAQIVLEVLKKNLKIVHDALVGQIKFRNHLEGEPVSAQSVLQWGVSGPAMRAAGLNFDLRKSQPFYFYQDVDFDIPVGIHGTTYDRYLIRYEEIYQSLRIITQVLDNLPLGNIMTQDFDKNYIEQLTFFASLERPWQWHYSAIESPAGECGFMIRQDTGVKPLKVKMKTPGFTLAQALPIFVKGLSEDQLSTCLVSLGLSRWEMDR